MTQPNTVFEPRISIITLGVADMARSMRFYRALGFETAAKDDAGWAIFKTGGVRLALYPRKLLAEDIAPGSDAGQAPAFGGITLAHNTRTREAVDAVLRLAEQAGGRIIKPATIASWGGYSGYFADPDGYPWEVAWSEGWKFDNEGTLYGGPLGDPPTKEC